MNCHACGGCARGLSRRGFLAAGAAATLTPFTSLHSYAAERQMPINTPLRVQPVLTYEIPRKREGTSYRSWGGIQTAQQTVNADAEIAAKAAESEKSIAAMCCRKLPVRETPKFRLPPRMSYTSEK